MAVSEEGALLQFVPFSSALDGSFWHALTKNKLEVYRLDEAPRSVHGFYSNGYAEGLPSSMNLDMTAFDDDAVIPALCFPSRGTLIPFNTLDAFKTSDKKQLLQQEAKKMWNDIQSGAALRQPDLLSRFLLLCFADLKKYHYYYWFAFPALSLPEKCNVLETKTLKQYYGSEKILQLQQAHDTFCKDKVPPAFVILEKSSTISFHALSEFEKLQNDQEASVMLGFSDPSTMEAYAGWPLRNLLALVTVIWAGLSELTVLCYRNRVKDGRRECSHSLVLRVRLSQSDPPTVFHVTTACPRAVGWEKNEAQRLVPRMVDLSSSMDPSRLAESAIDLNLKLMRWRLLPSLDLEQISNTRCLLLGAGTLGCNVARSLLNSEGISMTIPMPGHPVSGDAEGQVREDVRRLEELVERHDVVFLLLDTREGRWLPTLLAASMHKIVINAALGFDTFMVMRHGLKSDPSSPVAMETEPMMRMGEGIHGSRLGCYFCNDVVAPGDSTRDRTLDQQCTVSRPGMSMLVSALAVELLISLLQHPDSLYFDSSLSQAWVKIKLSLTHDARFDDELEGCQGS
ncbi:PREDICTED: ubiquitin-like modifier-activating enzyme ATG7 [Priapulus caudatus]|uniref:Ubiquitin-like modifier-activating enzyme ATG7 n=1 Tax=Priapulus caudatus TaxID=37621 RepID=A0ABM1EWC0_PRICU|nr:PREDICTED: ubiquitin-like modifier-activating enzyme ATG7 [Priapulus caudatus]